MCYDWLESTISCCFQRRMFSAIFTASSSVSDASCFFFLHILTQSVFIVVSADTSENLSKITPEPVEMPNFSRYHQIRRVITQLRPDENAQAHQKSPIRRLITQLRPDENAQTHQKSPIQREINQIRPDENAQTRQKKSDSTGDHAETTGPKRANTSKKSDSTVNHANTTGPKRSNTPKKSVFTGDRATGNNYRFAAHRHPSTSALFVMMFRISRSVSFMPTLPI